jgi:hypothetical protein
MRRAGRPLVGVGLPLALLLAVRVSCLIPRRLPGFAVKVGAQYRCGGGTAPGRENCDSVLRKSKDGSFFCPACREPRKLETPEPPTS